MILLQLPYFVLVSLFCCDETKMGSLHNILRAQLFCRNRTPGTYLPRRPLDEYRNFPDAIYDIPAETELPTTPLANSTPRVRRSNSLQGDKVLIFMNEK